MSLIIIAFGVLIGAAVGSFLGCAVYRVPRGLSLLHPPSSCPACNHRLTPRELVPVVSFAIQGGRARCCGVRLSPAYLMLEIICAVVGGAVAALLI